MTGKSSSDALAGSGGSRTGGRSSAAGLPPAPNEILVVDDDGAVREMIQLGLDSVGMRCLTFGSPMEALASAVGATPSVVIADLKMPEVEGLDMIRALCELRKHAVIVLSAVVNVPITVDAMKIGAFNVLQKPVSHDRLVTVVRDALAALSSGATTFEGFTPRERQVADLIMQGQTTKQIAQSLMLSPRTVEFFRTNLLRKTGATNVAALVSLLMREATER